MQVSQDRASTTGEPDLASRIAARLLSEFDIGHPKSDFSDDPVEFDEASEEEIAAIIRDEISRWKSE
jgi:hypothetical protein